MSDRKIGVLGCNGRVGKLIVENLKAQSITYAGGTTRSDTPDDLFKKADILIDFTTPAATMRHVQLAAANKKPLVIGTTGLTADQEHSIREACKDTAIVYAANTSIGVTLLCALVEQAAAVLGIEYDIEIAESHHKHKIDAPSGTALALGKAAQNGRKKGDFVTDRNGKRQSGDIGFAVQRGGDVVGEHMVTFYGEGERIELGHKATDRSLFAKGAIRAALWLKDQPNGLYSMKDVLSL